MGRVIIDKDYFSEEELLLVKKLVEGYSYIKSYEVTNKSEEKTNVDLVRLDFFPFYHFEENLQFWTDVFANGNDDYICKFFLSDYMWKLCANVMWPFHYEEELLKRKQQEYLKLFDNVSNAIIYESTIIDNFQRTYLLKLKEENKVEVDFKDEEFVIACNGEEYYKKKKIEIVMTKFHPYGDEVEVTGFLKSPIFCIEGKPRLYALVNNEKKVEVDIERSSWDYYKTKERICEFYRFTYFIKREEESEIHFYVNIGGKEYDTNYYFMPEVVFNNQLKRYRYYNDGYVYRMDNNSIKLYKVSADEEIDYFSQKQKDIENQYPEYSSFRLRIREKRRNTKKIYLYYDCKGVDKDNGYFQFRYDFKKKDGIKRYYILNDEIDDKKDLFTEKQLKNVVRFGSEKHKELYCLADTIVTAFAEPNNYMPFKNEEYKFYQDVSTIPRIVYLQHGVFHAHIPWKYSSDRLQVDLIVVTAEFEYENIQQIYGFKERQVIYSKMPRNDLFDLKKKPLRKIMYAPSWRKYLVDMVDHQWISKDDAFLESRFFKETTKILTDKRLIRYLKFHRYTLEFKLHPILYRYKDLYNIDGKYVKIAENSVSEEDYKIFITDFSNYIYDFAYLRRKLIYFFPDYMEFLSGMSDYRESERPFEDGIGDFAKDSEQLFKCIKKSIRRRGRANKHQLELIEKMYPSRKKNARKQIYNRLTQY